MRAISPLNSRNANGRARVPVPMKDRAARQKNNGYIYTELCAAIFVLSVGLLGAFQVFRICLDQTKVMNESAIAMRAIQNEVETLRALPFQELSPGTVPFRSDASELTKLVRASATVNVSAAEGLSDALRQVDVSVSWASASARTVKRSVTTLIARKSQ
jgi:Tfp pilus assembly protein PilV